MVPTQIIVVLSCLGTDLLFVVAAAGVCVFVFVCFVCLFVCLFD